MINTVKILLSILLQTVYLLSIAGLGRYSCHCKHSSQITFLGVSTECTCTRQDHFEDPGHCCPCCGEHLITQSLKKDDCCSVKFYFLDTDQDNCADSYSIVQFSTLPHFFEDSSVISSTIPVQSRIKTFQSVFRLTSLELYDKNRQLLL